MVHIVTVHNIIAHISYCIYSSYGGNSSINQSQIAWIMF